MKVKMSDYRTPSEIEGVNKYVAPKHYHWECHHINYGKIVWGGDDMDMYPYVLTKDNNYEEMDNNINIDNINNDNKSG